MLDAEQQTQLVSVRRQLREFKGLAEGPPGLFKHAGKTFVELAFDEQGGYALMQQVGPRGSGIDRMMIDSPVAIRKFLDEAKKRWNYLLEE